jgi:hypothetical protein
MADDTLERLVAAFNGAVEVGVTASLNLKTNTGAVIFEAGCESFRVTPRYARALADVIEKLADDEPCIAALRLCADIVDPPATQPGGGHG